MNEITVETVEKLPFILKVLELFAMFPNDLNDSLLWRCDGQYAPVTFVVKCSDTFGYATADCEVIETEHDLCELERAIADCAAEDEDDDELAIWYGPILWVARKRGRKPLRSVVSALGGTLRELFEEVDSRG